MADDTGRELVNAAELMRELQGLVYKQERTDDRIAEIVKEAVAIEARVRALESYAQSRAIIEAREDERDKALHDRLTRMEEYAKETRTDIKGELNAIKSIAPRSLWLIATAIVSATISGITAYLLKK